MIDPMAAKRQRRSYPFPIHTLEQALSVGRTIQDRNSGQPYDRIRLAGDLGTTPSSSAFNRLLVSSSRYGITEGNYRSVSIGLTDLGRAILAPTSEEERSQGLISAAIKPQVFEGFYRWHNTKKLPENTIAKNFLNRELEVRTELLEECLGILKANGRHVGILLNVSGAWYVNWEPMKADSRAAPHARTGTPQPADGQEVHPKPSVFIGYDGPPDPMRAIQECLDGFGVAHKAVDLMGGTDRPVSETVAESMRQSIAGVLVFSSDKMETEQRYSQHSSWMMMQLGAAALEFNQRLVVFVQHGLLPREQEIGLPTVFFEKTASKESLGALLIAMHKAGVINVSAS